MPAQDGFARLDRHVAHKIMHMPSVNDVQCQFNFNPAALFPGL